MVHLAFLLPLLSTLVLAGSSTAAAAQGVLVSERGLSTHVSSGLVERGQMVQLAKRHHKHKRTKKHHHKKAHKKHHHHHHHHKAHSSTAPHTSQPTGKGLVGFTSSNCGSSGASSTDPNGSQSFLNCGLSKNNPGSGWKPPSTVKVNMLSYVTLDHALASNSDWSPCKPYIPLFNKYGAQYGLPPILLASFAMQESTCNPNAGGDNGGAFGLMQITKDKCGGRDAAACASPEYNVATAASYFKSVLDQSNGDILAAMGAYNGWYPGMSYSAATSARWGGCCDCQQNLDYLYQMLNGWIMGKTGYNLGSVRNLDVCGSSN